jgi:peptidoglycan/xylan/chitin deacetylase (PgdA/CDA1 family)
MAVPIILKVDVDTLRGTREGVPQLVRLFDQHQVPATFLFSLGPDNTGRAIRRVFRPGFLSKVSRTSVLSHYGLKTLLYGTLLPGPQIAQRAFREMQAVQKAGYETGVHTWDHNAWQDCLAQADDAWVERTMSQSLNAYRQVFGAAPRTHGAAGWQMHPHAFRLLDRLGFQVSSDCRGHSPFIPVVDGTTYRCPQVPTTLPTLDELIGVDGLDEANVAQALLQRTQEHPATIHVFTLHAELEGMKMIGILDQLIQGWKAQGYDFQTLGNFAATLNPSALPRHAVEQGEVPGRSGNLCLQGKLVD